PVNIGPIVKEAAGGEERLAALADQPADVVVMDVRMPGISGVEALHRIRKRRLDAEVILLTGHADARDGVEGIKSGAFDYLNKPVVLDHLFSKIIQAYDKILGEKQKEEVDEYRARAEQGMIAAERLAALGPLAGVKKKKEEQDERIRKAEARRLPRRGGNI
ncbi:MAG: response regulator, partial [Desulfobacterales bacterium]|nr:response regulator [Desulfobacterales bacterium]